MKILLVFLLFAPVYCALGEIYKWVDENGVTHYSKTKPNNLKSDKIQLKATTNKQSKQNTSIQLTEEDIAGQWLVDEGLFLPSSEGITVIWEFTAGDWTVIKEGKTHPGGTYQLIDNTIDFGEMFFEVIELKSNSIKADSAGLIFTMKRR